MRIGRGKATLLAVMVFLAGAAGAPVAVHAQDEAPPVYVTPNSEQTSKPLFLQKLFGTDSPPNPGMGKPRPYDFSHRNDPAPKRGFDKEANDEFYRQLAENVSRINASFSEKNRARVAAVDQDRQRAYAQLAQLRAVALAGSHGAQIQAKHVTPNNLVRHQPKKERAQRSNTSRSGRGNQSSDAPPIYVPH